MEKEEILKSFQEFIKDYDEEENRRIWLEKSKEFRDFWNNQVMNSTQEIPEGELDEIIRILDSKAKGHTKETEAVAMVMIPQGVWYRMFNEIVKDTQLKGILNKIFISQGRPEIIPLIDELYRMNEGRKNSLTGKSANAINAMLFAFNPLKNISAVSLNDRKKIIEYFGFSNNIDFENDSPGKKIYLSNKVIINGFSEPGIKADPRTISNFLYSIKKYWKSDISDLEIEAEKELEEPTERDSSLFHMEKELENFIIENWDKIDFGEEYELIEENGNVVSQQYKTDIGTIDILAKDKKTGQLVVIELKRNQTSDDTIGQLMRYMGWLEEHKTNHQPVKGIIISAKYDKKLDYALKKINDVQVYLYEVGFILKEFKKDS